MAGPPRTPTVIKRVRGTDRPDRTRNEPSWPTGSTRPPAMLDADARREWRRLVPLLAPRGLFPAPGIGVFVGLCDSWSLFLRASRELRADGYVTTTPSGYSSPSPWVAIRRQALAEYLTAAARFGLDPASSGKVSAATKEDDDDFGQLLKRAT